MSREILIALIFLVILSILAVALWYWKDRSNRRRGRGSAEDDEKISPGGTECPLCGEYLPRGVRVHSAVYPGREFDLMRIYGCPNCWSGHPLAAGVTPKNIRRCPYCGDTVGKNGYVMAQVYRKPGRRPHVHVYGCTVCKPGRG